MDWAMQEALEEVDALTPACPPIAPPRRLETGRFYEMDRNGMINGVPVEVLQLQGGPYMPGGNGGSGCVGWKWR